MAKIGAQKAANMTGVSKATIQRAMKSGRLSYEVDEHGQKLIDTSELERVFTIKQDSASTSEAMIKAELQKATDMLEMERVKMRLRMLEDQLHITQQTLEDVKEQREQWQKQAQQVLITSQHSQKAAEELKQELKDRDAREKEIRQKQMEMRMKRMQAQNQNQEPAQNATIWTKLFKRA
ncbi:MAG: entry exclusion 1 domain-containing protein [Micavibrio aeruginosavorus]|uniref:Entry exclusion 1 domain-containing protein n=1 Tax=Micavibrio aeruginosavorus TaxID=349221 RepID=A0A2W5HCM4_9BACT|nr:MAG: entry exclusion 1 domain-containing protein [Micavibrio aeruginosavorus]